MGGEAEKVQERRNIRIVLIRKKLNHDRDVPYLLIHSNKVKQNRFWNFASGLRHPERNLEREGEGGVRKARKSGDILYGRHLRCFQVLVEGKQRSPNF